MTISRRQLLQYSLIATPIAFASMPLYVHAPDYYATNMGASLATMGIILLVLRFLDAIQDPLIGHLSDRWQAKRFTIILAAACVMVVSFTALFQPPSSASLIWFACWMLLATFAYSTLSINVNTLGGFWSPDHHEKTRITTWREAFGLIGLLLAVLLPSMFIQYTAGHIAFAWVSLLLAILMIIALFTFRHWYQGQSFNQDQRTNTPNTQPSKHLWQLATTLPPKLKGFFLIYGISMLASTIPALLVLFFIRDRLELEAYTGLFLLSYFLFGAIGMPLWQTLSKHHGKHRAWALAMLLAVISFIWAFFLDAGDLWQYLLICMISGTAFGADLALPPSILADHIEAANTKTDATLQFSLLTFLAKAALALASAITLPLLDIAGFIPGEDNTQSARQALSLAYAAIPCAIKLLAILLLWLHTCPNMPPHLKKSPS